MHLSGWLQWENKVAITSKVRMQRNKVIHALLVGMSRGRPTVGTSWAVSDKGKQCESGAWRRGPVPVTPHPGGREVGRGYRVEGTNVCLWLIHDGAKAITILQSNYPPITINQLKEKKKTRLETTMQAGDRIPGHCSQRNRNLCSHKPCTRVFTAPLFVTDRNWSRPRCPSVGGTNAQR